MNKLLDGKVAVITGAARGMGESEARLFAEQGAQVVLADILDDEGETVAQDIGDAAHYVHLDVSQEEGWQCLVANTIKRLGKIDILINNAAVLHFSALEHTPLEDYMRVISINQVGTFLGMKTVTPHMKEKKSGSIINVSSVDGLKGSNGLLVYAASKWAVRGMTKAAAAELGHSGIRVNSIHPGGVNTAMSPGDDPGVQAYFKKTPLGRVGEPNEVANMALFLGSEMGSYCTGGEYVVDGGMVPCELMVGLPGAEALS